MKAIKKFYNNLYQEKIRPGYKKECEKRRKDFLHKYILFFLDPNKNTRHEIVRKTLPSGETYLDIGCWTGDSTIYYGVLDKFKEVHAVDISEEALKQATLKDIKTNIIDVNDDNLPFSANYFDCVTLAAVLEHLIDPYHILGEIKKILKLNGILIICVPNVASLSNRVRILTGHIPRTSFDIGWDGGHLLYFTPDSLGGLLKQYGFEIIEKYATGNLQFLRKLFFNLVGEFIFKCRLTKK